MQTSARRRLAGSATGLRASARPLETCVARVMRLLALIVFGFSAPAVAQSLSEPPPLTPAPVAAAHSDYIIVEGHSVRIPSVAATGGAGGVHWLRTTRGGATLSTGVEAFSIAGSRWTVANAGGAFRPFANLVLHSQARVGRGRLTGEAFDYRMYEGGIAYRAGSRLHLTLADQYWHVADTRGHLIKPGLSWLPHRRLSADLTYARSAHGNLDANLVAGRLGMTIRSVTVIGGVAEGRGTAELFDLTVRGAADKSLKERFAGFQIQLPRAQLMLLGSDLVIAAVHKRTLAASIQYRLGAK